MLYDFTQNRLAIANENFFSIVIANNFELRSLK